MTTLLLNDGVAIPVLGFGTGTALLRSKLGSSGLETVASESIDRDVVDTIKSAIRAGYRHLDTAEMYQTEPELGVALKEVFSEGLVTRRDLFITTKISSDYSRALEKIEISLKKLGLDYVDLYLIHSPYLKGPDADLQGAWAAMQAVKASGKARSIGVSNYEPSHLATTLAGEETQTPPSINQVELHPYLRQEELLAFSRTAGGPTGPGPAGRGVAVAAYGALHPVTRNPSPGGALDRVLARLAARHGVSAGLVCLRWCIERGAVVVTTTRREERMREFLGVLGFSLAADEVAEVSEAGAASLPPGVGELVPRAVQYHRRLEAARAQKGA